MRRKRLREREKETEGTKKSLLNASNICVCNAWTRSAQIQFIFFSVVHAFYVDDHNLSAFGNIISYGSFIF